MASESVEKVMDYPEHVNPNPAFLNLRQVSGFTQLQSEALFNALPKVRARELNGRYKGKLYSIKGTGVLPLIVRKALIALLHTPLALWAGKRFTGSEGANLWFARLWGPDFGYYAIEENPDTGELEGLDYQLAKNLPALRPIYGEVRKLGNGLFFCRMMYRTKNQDHCLLYFSLSEL